MVAGLFDRRCGEGRQARAGSAAMVAEATAVGNLLLRLRRSPVRAAESGELHPNGIGTGIAGQAHKRRHVCYGSNGHSGSMGLGNSVGSTYILLLHSVECARKGAAMAVPGRDQSFKSAKPTSLVARVTLLALAVLIAEPP